MLMRLAMLCVAVGLTGWAWPQIPRDGSQQNQKAEHSDAEPHPAPPIPQVLQSQQGTTKEKQQSDPEPSHYQWCELLAPGKHPKLVLGFGRRLGCRDGLPDDPKYRKTDRTTQGSIWPDEAADGSSSRERTR
jgi:hypothetical protein